MADPFEEFEFKPLTEGLGFHKKAEQLKSDIKSTMAQMPTAAARPMNPAPAPIVSETSRAASQSISELMASLPPSLDFLDDKQDLARPAVTPMAPMAPSTPITPSMTARPQIFQPLAREEYKSSIASGPTVGSVLPAPGTKAGGTFAAAQTSTMAAGTPAASATIGGATYRNRMSESFAKTFPIDSARTETAKIANSEGLVPVAANFSAGLIDAMVVAGISTIMLVCIITITHINLVAMLSNAKTDGPTQANLAFLFVAVLQMYMLVSRAFFGASLGEWAFELQLGTSAQHKSMTYPLQALLRMLVVTVTGLFALPLLSFAFGRDLSRYVSGLQLYRRT